MGKRRRRGAPIDDVGGHRRFAEERRAPVLRAPESHARRGGLRCLRLERNCRLPESPAHSRRRNREGPASSKGLNSQRGFGPAVEPRRKSRPRSTSLHGSSPCKCQRLSTLRWDRLPPSRPSTKSGARAGGRRLSDRRLHRWLAGTSASAPSSHGAADLLGLNRAHICVRNQIFKICGRLKTGPQDRTTRRFRRNCRHHETAMRSRQPWSKSFCP